MDIDGSHTDSDVDSIDDFDIVEVYDCLLESHFCLRGWLVETLAWFTASADELFKAAICCDAV